MCLKHVNQVGLFGQPLISSGLRSNRVNFSLINCMTLFSGLKNVTYYPGMLQNGRLDSLGEQCLLTLVGLYGGSGSVLWITDAC